MPNDNFTLDQFQRIAMTLSEILANRPQNRALARASDVPGADLQWMYTAAYPTGAWYGDLGELGTNAFRDSLFTGYLALGVTCKVSGVPYSWGGVMVGWRRVDGLLYCAVDPLAVVNAASTSPVDFVVTTIPGGTFGDGDILDVFFPSETGASNVGNDSFALVVGSTLIDSATAAGALLTQVRFGVTKNGATTRKIIAAATTGLRTNLFSTTAIDWSIDQIIKVRIIPATAGNSSYVRHISAKVTEC